MGRRLLVLGVLVLSHICGYGQVESSATADTIPISVGGFFSYYDASYEGYKVAGFGTFIDYSPFLEGDLGVEGEARWLNVGASHGFSQYNYLVGPRYRFLSNDKYHPYAKFLVGAGLINFPYGLAHGGYFAMAPGGGVDITLKEHWKFRVDYEIQFWPSAFGIPGIQTGSVHPNGVSVGFNYRIFSPRYEWRTP